MEGIFKQKLNNMLQAPVSKVDRNKGGKDFVIQII